MISRKKAREAAKRVFYGYYDKLRRSPIVLEIKSINTGIQRVFNSVEINEQIVRNYESIEIYGLKEIGVIQIPYISDRGKIFQIGEEILSGLIHQKEELEIKVLSKDVQGLLLGDSISIDFNSNVLKLDTQDFLPLYGLDRSPTFPFEEGRIIPRAVLWEIYEKNEKCRDFNCMLKLRQL